MKRLLLMLIVFFISNPCFGEWKFIVRDKKNGITGNNYINTKNIEIKNGYLYFWTLTDLEEPFQKMLSMTEYVKIDCDKKRYKSLQLFVHEKNMGKGQSYRISDDLKWYYPLPGSFLDKIRRNSCD